MSLWKAVGSRSYSFKTLKSFGKIFLYSVLILSGYFRRVCQFLKTFLSMTVMVFCAFPAFYTGPDLLGVGSLLKKYTALLCTHISDILPVATSIASASHRHFAEVSHVVDGDLTGGFLLIVPLSFPSTN